MALEKELATYQAHLADLRQHEGKFVLIQGDSIIDLFVAYEDAINEGYRRFGLTPFLVKHIHAVEPVYYFTRPITPAAKVS